MYGIKALMVCVGAGVLFTGLPATAQQLGPPDQRRDWYELLPQEQDLLRYAEANCIAAKYEDLRRNKVGDYELHTKGWNHRVRAPYPKICDGARFLGQQTGGRHSAVLVGPDTVLAAEHAFPDAAACRDRWLVFDFFQRGPNNPQLDPTGGKDKTAVPAENVYKCKDWLNIPGADLVLLTLDRRVENGRRPLKINRDGGMLEVGSPVVTLGHPQSLPMKIDQGWVTSHDSPGARIGSSIHAAIRSSGSMLVDRTRGVLAGIVVTNPNWLTCPDNSCCADNRNWITTSPRSEDVSLAAPYVPQVGLKTTPAKGAVEMHGPIWGNFTNASTEYRISTSGDEPGDVVYEVSLAQNSGLFTLNGGTGPISGVLAPGVSHTFRVGVVLRRGYPVGIHDATISVLDRTYDTVDFRKHRLFVGTHGFSVGPEGGFYGPVPGPGPGAAASETTHYVVENRYAGAQDIHVSTSHPWLRVNGVNTPFVLQVPGQNQGATEFARVSLDDTGLSNGLYRGEITFESHPFDGSFAETREVWLDVGREIYPATGPVQIRTDPTISHGFSNVEIPITLPSGGRLQDVDVQIHMDYQNSLRRSILVELLSPPVVGGGSIELRLYNSGPARSMVLNGVFDDITHPLGTAHSLTSLENIHFQSGDWALRISHGDGSVMQGSGTVHSASLRVTHAGSTIRSQP